MGLLRLFPIMLAPAIFYALIVLIGGGKSLATDAFTVPMASGDTWHITRSALFLTFSLACFFVELLRTASPSKLAITANMIVALAFAPCLIVFLLVRGFATNEFFLVILMMLLDFLLDSAVLVFTSRRSIEVDRPTT